MWLKRMTVSVLVIICLATVWQAGTTLVAQAQEASEQAPEPDWEEEARELERIQRARANQRNGRDDDEPADEMPPERRPPVVRPVRPAPERPTARPAPTASERPTTPRPGPMPTSTPPPVEAARPAAADERVIYLQYQDVPITSVVRRVSQAAGKPLIGDYNVDGTITFFDSEPYTLTEAMDTINILLGMHNYHLIEDGRFLRLVTLDDTAGMPWPIRAGLDETTHLRDEQRATVLLPLTYLDAKEAGDLVVRMVSSSGSIAPLPKSKGLLITDRLSTIRRVGAFLKLVDTEETAEDAQMRIKELKYAKASDVAKVIDNLWGPAAAPRRMVYDQQRRRNIPQPPDPADIIRTSHDDRTNILVISGEPSKLKLAEGMIERLDRPDGAAGGEFRIYELKHANADELAATINETLGLAADPRLRRRTPTTTADTPRVTADAATNRLIVSAPVDRIAEIERLIEKLDDARAESSGSRVFRLEHADAQQMSSVITSATRKRDALGRMIPTVNVSADPTTNTLIVAGSAGDLDTAATLIEQLDVQSPTETLEVRVVHIDNGDVRILARSLSSVLAESTPGGGSRNRRLPPQLTGGRIRVEADPTSSTLIIAAPADEWPRIEKVLAGLEMATASSDTTTQLIPLAHASAEEMAATLRQVLGPVRRGGRAPSMPIQIAPSRQANALLVTASQEDIARVTELVGQLDVADAADAEAVTMIQLTAADANQVAATLKSMLPRAVRGGQQEVFVAADPTSNMVLLRGPAAERAQLEAMVADLDAATSGTARETRIHPLEHVSAAELAPMLTELYASSVDPRARGRRGVPSLTGADDHVTIAPAPGDRALVIDAPADKLEPIIQLILSLDVESGGSEPLLPRSYSLEVADAQELARSLGRLFAEQQQQQRGRRGIQAPTTTGGEPQPRFEAERASNTLLVAATAEQYVVIEELIASLEAGAELTEETKVFTLKYAEADELAELLRTMLEAETTSTNARGRRVPQLRLTDGPAVRVAAQASTHSLIVQGPPEKIALAAELIAQFDVADAGRRTVIEIVQLDNAQAASLAEAVTASLAAERASALRTRRNVRTPAGGSDRDTVTVTAEPNSNSVLIRGPAAEVPAVVEMIRRLDGSGNSTTPQLRTYQLEHTDAANVADQLGTLFRDMIKQVPAASAGRGRASSPQVPFSISADTRTNSLIVSTTEAYFTMFEELLNQLEQPVTTDREVHYIPLVNADAYDLADQLRMMFPEEGPSAPIIESDLFSNSLTIIAKDLDFRRMEPIIQEVDRVATVTVRVIPVSALKAHKLAEQLRRIYPQVSDGSMEVVEELPARNGREVTATAPARDGTIRPADDVHGQAPPPSADEPMRPPVLIAVDEVTNSLIVSGTTQDLDTVEDLITQLSMGAQNAEEEFRWFKIEQADPEAVAATLNALFNPTAQARARTQRPQQRQPSRGDDDEDDRTSSRQRQPQPQPPAPTPRIAVVADPRTRHIIVRAKPTELDMIEGIIGRLDQVSTVVTEVRTFPLKNTDATEVAENLQQLFRLSAMPSASRAGRSQPNLARAEMVRQMLEMDGPEGPVQVDASSMVAVTANRATNSLVVSAPAEAMAVIAGIVQELDQSAGESTRPVVRLYPVGGGDLNSLAETIQTIFADAAVARGPRGGRTLAQGQRTPVIVTADAAAGVLIVSASADQHELIATVLHDVQAAQAAAGEAVVRVYKIRHADATQVANAVQGTFDTSSTSTRRPGRRGSTPAAGAALRVTADTSSNSVVISATPDEHERIAAIITEMDTTPGGESLVRAIPLDHADAEATAQVLTRVFAPDARGRRSAGATVVIEGNRDSRTLLVRADNDTFERIRAMAEQLHAAGSQAAGVFILPLTRANAAQMAQRVSDLHNQQVASARRTGSTVEPIAVTADERANALVLACTAEQFEQVSQWVNQIEEMNPRRGEPRIIKLEHADPEEVEQAIRQLFGGSAPPRRGAGAGDDTLPFEMTVLPNQRQLLIEASDEDWEMIRQLVESLDTAAAATRPEMRLFVLEHANPTRVAQSLNQMFQRIARSGRAEDAVTITALEQTRSIVVAGSAERIEDAARLIEQLDTETVSPEVQFKIYPLEHARPSKVIGLLDTMLQEYRRANPDQPIGLVADEPTRSIVVTGRPKAFEEIEKILTALDVEPATPATEVRIIPLLKAEAEALADVLNEMLRPSSEGQVTPEARALQEQVRRLKVVGPDGRAVPELDLTRPIKINADPSGSGSNALILSSTPENVAALAAVVAIMDTVPISETVEVRIAHLEHADAASVVEVLQEIFAEGADQLAGRPGGPVAGRAEPATQPGRALVKPLNVSADARTNTLILSGAPDTLELAARVIKDLDQEASGVATEVRLFKLEHADAVRLAEVLEAVFAEDDGGDDPAAEGMRTHVTRLVRTLPDGEQLATQFPRTRAALTIQADEATNTLVIAARKDMMPLIADVIASMDIPGAGAMNGVRIFPLTHANAGTMATMLQDLFDRRYEAARTEDLERQKPIILPEPRTNCLLVVANESDSQVLTDLLARLDVKPVNPSVHLAVLALTHNDAGVVGPMIEDIFDARRDAMTPQGTEPAPQDQVNVEVDALNNALIISASSENLEMIRDLLAKVDVEPSAVEGIVRLYPLINADAQRIADLLEGLVSDGLYKPGLAAGGDSDLIEAREKVSIVADIRTNVLVVSASRENFAVIEKIIAQLDATDGYGLLGDVRLYTLDRADAETLADTLREFFASKRAAEEASGSSGRLLEVTIVSDGRTNTLLVAGGRECFAQIEAMIDRLDGDGEPRGEAPAVFPLHKGRAADVVESITQLYESQGGLEKIGLSISADERTNAVIVSGGAADVERIGQIVEKLDAGNVTHVMEIRVIPLRQADATELADLLDETLTSAPRAPGGDDATRQAMIQFIRTLPGGKEIISRALQEGVLVTPDARANALVVVAAADSMNLLTNLIEALDSVATPAAQIRVFRLVNADAAQMATVLSELFRLEGSDGDPKAASYTLTTADGTPGSASVTMDTAAKASLTVTVDTRTNRLLLGGSEQYVGMAAQVIEELDADPGLERVPVVYRLRNAKATDIEEAVRQWLDDERQRLIDAMGGDAGAVPRLLEQEVSVVAVTNTTTIGDSEIETSNTLLIAASQRYLDTILSMIDQLDQPQPQVHIGVIMAAVRLDESMELGIDWDLQMEFEWDTENLLNASTFLGTVGSSGFLDGGLNLAVTGGDVKFFLQALKSRGNLEVIARPTITAMDNHPAMINIVERVPYLTNMRITDSGGVINSVDYEEVGVILDVTPRISPDGFILMDVKPELSSQSGTSLDLGGGASSPIFSTRQASTTVSVRDGQSVVIGGLIDTQKDDIETKVPLLGDLPLLGRLFKRTTQEERRTEFLMILTPQIIRDETDAQRLTRREIDRTHLRPESLAPYNQALFGDGASRSDEDRLPANTPATLDGGVAPRSVRLPARRGEPQGPNVTVIGGER